jgi:hypothetical protein
MLRTIVRERWKGWSPRQRTMAIAVAAGAAALVVAVVALPGAPSASDPPGVGAVESPAPVETPAHDPPSAVTQDDPLAALGELLTRRTECFRDLSVLCFDDVDEQGSAALDHDRAAVNALMADGEQPVLIGAGGATIVERMGDSVLVALAPGSEPASVLLLKGEAGWRIRDYLAANGGA